MAYIDKDKMLKYLDETHTDNEWLVGQYNADWIYSFIESQPDVDVVKLPEDIGLQKINIKKYENEFDGIAKDLFKIDEEYSGGAKVWVRTDVYKKLMRILALSNHLVKVLRILITKENSQ